MSSNKRDRMAAAACTRAVLAAIDDANEEALVSSALTTRRGFWAVTTVKHLAGGASGGELVAILAESSRVPAREVKIAGSLFGGTVKVWWKD